MACITETNSRRNIGSGRGKRGFKLVCAIYGKSTQLRQTVNRVELAIAPSRGESNMKCERCMSNEEGIYRVSSDVMDVRVCPACASEARRLRLAVERLEPDYGSRVSSSVEARLGFAH